MKRFFVLTLMFAALAGVSLAADAPQAGAPALWSVTSPTAKVYLFGTIHLMKPGVVWTTPAIDAALAASDDLWLEVPDNLTDPQAILPQVQTLGLDPAHPLSTKLSKADLALLDAKVKSAGLPGEAVFEPFRPWLASLMLTVLQATAKGYSANTGIDVTLRQKMQAAGKPIKGFETIDQQLHFFADLPPEQEIALLHASLAPDDAARAEPGIDQLESLWQSGNVDQAARMESKIGTKDPTLSAALVTGRNAAWAKQLDARLHAGGTSFVAVGLMHLAGPGSLIEDLTKLGYTVSRIE